MSSTATVQSEHELKHRTSIPEQPITERNKPLVPESEVDENGKVDNYAVPRANVAATREAPNGTEKDKYNYHNRKKTVLEQHCFFFDRDNDGVIWPTDTWATCRDFGWGIRLSLFFTCFLHLVQSWGTVPWFFLIPDPLFRVWIHNIHMNKHGSSTLAFDNEGRFRPQFFDEFFARNDKEGKGGLTFWEGYHGLRRIRFAWDIFGQISAFFEWGMTYVLLWPEDGVVRKEDARRVLDGSIFHEMTMQHRKYNGGKEQY